MVRSLQSNVWTLQSGSDAAGTPIDGLMVPGKTFQMRFQDARVSIQGGCNTQLDLLIQTVALPGETPKG